MNARVGDVIDVAGHGPATVVYTSPRGGVVVCEQREKLMVGFFGAYWDDVEERWHPTRRTTNRYVVCKPYHGDLYTPVRKPQPHECYIPILGG